MRSWLTVLALTSACGAAEPRAPRHGTADAGRCTVRISKRGIFVDGKARSRDVAVAACRATDGAIVVLEDLYLPKAWDAAQRTLVRKSDAEVASRWRGVREALEREGVWFYIRGVAADARTGPLIVPVPMQPERVLPIEPRQ